MNTKKLTIAGFAIGAILIAGLPRPAAAVIDELLMYPGANCTKQSGGSPTFLSNGRLRNNTAANITVQCPMYDRGANFTGRVWVFTPPNLAVSCSSNATNPLAGASSPQMGSASGNPGAISFSGPTNTGTFTYRFYNCTLPPGTEIINYRGQAL